jgi:phospholipid/cholesterol/gamma-HCH transport system substrate-binding protein
MRRLLVTLVVIASVVAGMGVAGVGGGGDVIKRYDVEFDNAFGLVEGGDLQIGGVNAGKLKRFRLHRDGRRYTTIAEVEVTEPGFGSLRSDARCDVRQQSLIGEYFIDCDLGSKGKPEIADGGLIPRQRTSSTVPPDLLNTVMRRPYRERFRLLINELGTGLAGRPEELNEVIRRAHPALRETSETIAILRRQNREIRDFIAAADEVSRRVEPKREFVARWAEESADTAEIQASRAEQLGRYWNRLPDFLAELEPTMAELGATAEQQIPTLRKLGRAAPELDSFLRAAEPFARSSRGSIDDLGEAAGAGRSAIRESRQEVRTLRSLSPLAPRLAKPLRQFLQAIDDRRRSTEHDPQAAGAAPPRPDKTAYRSGQGFTGMEGLWNYFYYQTLAINSFDKFGHLLRIVLFARPCGPYSANPDKEEIEQCNSWLGPFQPGVTHPDPTDGGAAARRERRARASRSSGAPEADPRPTPRQEARRRTGRRYPATPQITLPPEVRELLAPLGRALPKNGAELPRRDTPDPTGALDYLLGP